MSILGETEKWKLYNQFIKTMKERKYKYKYNFKSISDVKINIITPETGWIISKFGQNVYEELRSMNYNVTISDVFDDSADINHYFFPANIGYSRYSKVDENTTFMITHIDTAMKVDQVRSWTEKGAMGICMSNETMTKLSYWGVERNKLCYVNPPVDSEILPNKAVLGFTYRLYSDGRKRENIMLDICKRINPKFFMFKIMGSGWEIIVDEMEKMGFEVEYYDSFDKDKYNELIKSLDYYCYFGFDEGSMGYLDALAAGVDTIVTPQGYHLDTPIPITHPVNTYDDIIRVLHAIEEEKQKALDFINEWTWKTYTLKHIEIWKYILGIESIEKLMNNAGRYMDGINSVLFDDFEYFESFQSIIKRVTAD